ncbi:MAG TPA: hypothetical protein VEO01_29860 [Pseudonocardiaceae bacterium]|nr:hypothetical protein [Pseudonocardiaceae bacterium]
MVESTWQQRVDTLGRGHYVRYDESTGTALGDSARSVLDVYHGDLRRIRPESDADIPRLREALRGFPRIGETGAHIFCREAQVVWPALRPYFDRRALSAARQFGLPTEPDELAGSVDQRLDRVQVDLSSVTS